MQPRLPSRNTVNYFYGLHAEPSGSIYLFIFKFVTIIIPQWVPAKGFVTLTRQCAFAALLYYIG